MKAMPHLEDDPVTQTRINMVEGQLKPGGVRDYRLTKMICNIAREAFVAADVRSVAYADRELPSQAGDARRQLPPSLLPASSPGCSSRTPSVRNT